MFSLCLLVVHLSHSLSEKKFNAIFLKAISKACQGTRDLLFLISLHCLILHVDVRLLLDIHLGLEKIWEDFVNSCVEHLHSSILLAGKKKKKKIICF